MPLVYGAIVPHPPLLLPSIGKENADRLTNTRKAFIKLALGLKQANADTILIISPHGTRSPNSFTLDIAPEYRTDFAEFGDLATKRVWKPNIELAAAIAARFEPKFLVRTQTHDSLDHGSAVPLSLLTEGLPNMRIVPLSYAGLDHRAHFRFGLALRTLLAASSDRIAVIASGDLAHTLTKESPGGYAPQGAKLDQRVREVVSSKRLGMLLRLNPELVAKARECGLKSILVLGGAIHGLRFDIDILHYEAPFGVGYLTAAVTFPVTVKT
jgi:MEMO1 family protein